MPSIAELLAQPSGRPKMPRDRLMAPSPVQSQPPALTMQPSAPPQQRDLGGLLMAASGPPQSAVPFVPEQVPANVPTRPVGAVDAKKGTLLYDLAQRQRHAPRPHAKPTHEADILAGLLSKLTPGAAAPAEGMVPFGELPPEIQSAAGKVWQQPLVGFDPRQLNPRELALLEQLRGASRNQVSQRVAANEAKNKEKRRG